MELAARIGTMAANGGDEAMWKELFLGLMGCTYNGKIVLPKEVVIATGRNYTFAGQTNMTELEWDIEGSVKCPNGILYGIYSCKKFVMPNVTELDYFSPIHASYVEDFYIPKVRSFKSQNVFYQYNSSHMNVHIEELTCAEIKNISGFPGATEAKKPTLTFVGSDGVLNYDGSEWVFTPSSTEGGGTKCLTRRRVPARFSRPSARFCARSTSQRWEVAA